MRGKEYSAGSSAVFLTVLAVLSQGLTFVYRAALSRMVGAEVMGLYQLLMPAYSVMMSLTAVGVTACASNLTAQYLALGNGKGLEQVRRSCLLLMAAGMALLSVVVVLGYDPISVYLLGDARTQLGLVMLLPCVLLTGVENLHKHIFYGSGQVRPPALVELAEQGIRTAAVLGLLAVFLPQNPERTVGLIVLGMVLCEIFSAVSLLRLYRRRFSGLRNRGAGETRRVRLGRITGIALPVSVTSLLGNIMGAANATLIPRKLVQGGMTRSQALAEFGVLCGMTMPMLALPTVFLGAVNLVTVPALARMEALGQPERIRTQIRRTMTAVSVLILPSMAMMVVLGPDLAEFIFREPKAGRWMLPLAVSVVLGRFRTVFNAVLNGIGKQGQSALVCLLCDVVQLGFVFLVPMPGVGMRAFVAGTAVSELLGAALCARCVVKATRIRLPIFQSVAAPALGALLAGLTGNLLFRYLKDSGVHALPAGIGVCMYTLVLYLAALQAQGVSLSETFGRGRGRDQ